MSIDCYIKSRCNAFVNFKNARKHPFQYCMNFYTKLDFP